MPPLPTPLASNSSVKFKCIHSSAAAGGCPGTTDHRLLPCLQFDLALIVLTFGRQRGEAVSGRHGHLC